MKLIFLDIDGVLNSRKEGIHGIKQPHVNILRKIIRDTGCKIVLSSGWRLPSLEQTLSSNFAFDLQKMKGGLSVLNAVIDVTPEGNSRAEEIQTWIDGCNENIIQYIVLDDEAVPNPYLFKTEYDTGLTAEIGESIIEFFQG